MRYCQLRFSIVAIDADGICVEVFEQWYPLKNTSVPGGDKWHAILWFLPLTRVYRKVSRTNVPQSMSFWRLWASGENTHTAPDALRTLNKWCITPRGYSTRSMRVLARESTEGITSDPRRKLGGMFQRIQSTITGDVKRVIPFLHPTQINCWYMDSILRVAANAASVEGDSY